MPDRTTIVLPLDLKERAVRRARAEGISFAHLIRRAVESELAGASERSSKQTSGDSFLDNLRIFEDRGPTDWSTRVDEIVYGTIEDELRGHRRVSRAASQERSVSRRSSSGLANARPVRPD